MSTAEITNKCPDCNGDGAGWWPEGMGGGKCYEFDCETCGGTGDADRFDSGPATREHIRHVKIRLDYCAGELRARGDVHDASKLVGIEKEAFDRMTPILKTLTYGTEEYKASLKEIGPALAHHYANNSHHPEHYAEGVAGMDLFDVIEMLCDWQAASQRTKDGAANFERSLEINRERFKIDPQLAAILRNTWQRYLREPPRDQL